MGDFEPAGVGSADIVRGFAAANIDDPTCGGTGLLARPLLTEACCCSDGVIALGCIVVGAIGEVERDPKLVGLGIDAVLPLTGEAVL